MDSERFDEVTRFLALGVSRRGAVATVAALTGLRIAALDYAEGKKKKKKKKKKKILCKGLVGSCTSESQCCGDLACEDVPGFCPEEGTYCCARLQGACGEPCDCCGLLDCQESTCCTLATESCAGNADCCGNLECQGGDCCGLANESCFGHADCCGQLNCGERDGDTCQTCALPQDTCLSTDDCCLMDSTCGDNGCSTGDVCCQGLFGFCSGDCDCCENFVCDLGADQCVSGLRQP